MLLNSGIHPDIPRERMRLAGEKEALTWPDGSVAPGIITPIPLWYISTPELKLLVDTGISQPVVDHCNRVFRARSLNQVYEMGPEHDIDAFLRSCGTSAEEIDLVILTHLHQDHFTNASAYKNARFLVQRKELAWGLTPPPWSQFHWREFSPYLVSILDRIDTVDGDTRICAGVEGWLVGGHTPGSMAVAVDTAIGKVVIGGDFYYNYRNLEFSWPPGSFWCLDEWEASCQMIKRRSDLALPGHDYEMWTRHPGGTIG